MASQLLTEQKVLSTDQREILANEKEVIVDLKLSYGASSEKAEMSLPIIRRLTAEVGNITIDGWPSKQGNNQKSVSVIDRRHTQV